MLEIDAIIEDDSEIDAFLERDIDIQAELEESFVASADYNKLNNLPRLNGRVIKGDVSELDPTVPSWAKEENKPKYSADEIDAVPADGAITIAELSKMFGS